jgi:hypothetical protein
MYKILIILVLCSGSLSFGASPKNCGSSHVGSTKRAEEFLNQLRLSVADSTIFSNLFKLPIKVKFESGKTKKITSKDYFVKNHSKFMKSGLKALFNGKELSDYFCNYQGLAIARGVIWADAKKESGVIKIQSLNYSLKDFKTSFDKTYKAIETITYDQRVQFYKLAKDNDYSIPKTAVTNFDIYKVDITNDGKDDYVVTYRNSGSGKYSGIEAIIEVKNKKFIVRRLDSYKISDLPIKNKRSKKWKKYLSDLKNIEIKNFYSYLGKPFLYKKGRKIIVNFSNDGKINISYFFEGQYLRIIKD